jgi:hypothetical protein
MVFAAMREVLAGTASSPLVLGPFTKPPRFDILRYNQPDGRDPAALDRFQRTLRGRLEVMLRDNSDDAVQSVHRMLVFGEMPDLTDECSTP